MTFWGKPFDPHRPFLPLEQSLHSNGFQDGERDAMVDNDFKQPLNKGSRKRGIDWYQNE